MRSQTSISPLVSFSHCSLGLRSEDIGALVAIPVAVAFTVLMRDLFAPAIRHRMGATPSENS